MAKATKSTVKAVDANIESFKYVVDLTIDPPLSDSAARSGSTDFFKLKQVKDEDVVLVNGSIEVVSRNVTQVEQTATDYVYEYDELKKGLGALGKLAAQSGSTLTGQIIVFEPSSGPRFLRLVPDGTGKVDVVKANLSWPDGTSSVIPEHWLD